jgi:hypothetical protein
MKYIGGVVLCLCLSCKGALYCACVWPCWCVTNSQTLHLAPPSLSFSFQDAIQLGFLPPDVDTVTLLPVLQQVFSDGQLAAKELELRNHAGKFGLSPRRRRQQFGAVSGQLNQIFFDYPFSVPSYFALITRALIVLEGIAVTGDENFDLFRAAYP